MQKRKGAEEEIKRLTQLPHFGGKSTALSALYF
jgi:hypothetical protein